MSNSNYQLLIGWLQSPELEKNYLNNASTYLKNNKIASRYRYHEAGTVYFLHAHDIKSRWNLKSNNDISYKLPFNTVQNSSLAYILVSKNYHLSTKKSPINYEIFNEQEKPDDSNSKKLKLDLKNLALNNEDITQQVSKL